MNKATLMKIACILFAFCVTTAIASPAQVLTTLHTFTGYPNDGAGPNSALTLGSDGNYYGTTGAGGDNCSPSGCGTVFKITPGGTLTTLYSFCPSYPSPCTDGNDPGGALVQAPDGNFCGTTSSGGSGADNAGTVFKITPSGTLTTLYNFCSQPNCADGRYPGGVVLATDGNFYGVTGGGGSTNCTDDGCGTIFKITPSGTLTTLYTFCSDDGNCPNGYGPDGLIQATDGSFYGATGYGGASGNSCADFGCGTVFKFSPSGTLTTLYSFCSQNNCVDGWTPTDGLVQARDGNFYATTYAGGTSTYCDYGCGTIFRITPGGTLTTLYSFCSRSGCSDGREPSAALVQAADGDFYGSTGGGTSDDGTVFRLTLLRECSVCANVE